MTREKESRLSFKQAFSYSRRGLSIWLKTAPELFLATGIRQAVTALAPYVPLWFTAQLVNALAAGGGEARVWRLLAALLVSTAAAALARHAAECWENRLRDGMMWPAWNRIFFEKLLAMDFCDVDDPKTQGLLTRIRENNNYSGFGLMGLFHIFASSVEAVLRIAGALALSVSLFTLAVPAESPLVWLNSPYCLLGLLALMLLTVAAASALSVRGDAYWTCFDGAASNRLFGFFDFIALQDRHRAADIRTYAQDGFIESKGKDEMDGATSFGPNSTIGKAGRGPMGACMAASAAISYLFTGAVYLYAGLKAMGGAFGVGSVTQYVGALAGLSQGVALLLSTVGRARNNAEFLKMTFDFLDTPNQMYQGSLTTEKRADRDYEIEFRDVSFRYPGSDAWALRHVSMKFRVGERLAVVGENGSGKTTFIKLLCRLYDPTEGEILLNGIDIRKYQYNEYLALFSVVFQDFRLLAQPLGQNVAAAENYDRGRAKSCLEKAGFGARLATLANGLDTCLYREFEDDGVEISGGEAQKIALARVIYHDAPFIVLDEPTAALDPEAEAEVYTKFNDIVEDKTAIYISHRLSSCRFCDEIAVFDAGRVVQKGTHDALVEEAGKYRDLWQAQAQYYQKEKADRSLRAAAF